MNAQPFSIEYTVVAQTTSSEETKRCAAALARLLRGTEVIALDGDLGAGKTHFTQGLAEGLGIKRSVTSPTFNVLVVYDEGRIPLYHFDLYRLEKPEELDDIAFAEYVDSPGISCIEWASKFPEKLPDERLEVFLEVAAEDRRERVIKARALASRHASCSSVGEGSWLKGLPQRLSLMRRLKWVSQVLWNQTALLKPTEAQILL